MSFIRNDVTSIMVSLVGGGFNSFAMEESRKSSFLAYEDYDYGYD